jgi:hypothetical protein
VKRMAIKTDSCNCVYCKYTVTQESHDKRFIAEAVAIQQYIKLDQLPNLQKVLGNASVNSEIWLELVFLIKKIIENKIALTEDILHASIDLIHSERYKIGDYLRKRAKDYRKNSRIKRKVNEDAAVWEGVADDLESCAYVIDKGCIGENRSNY